MPNQLKKRSNFSYSLEVNQFLSYNRCIRANFDLFSLIFIFWRFSSFNFLYWNEATEYMDNEKVGSFPNNLI